MECLERLETVRECSGRRNFVLKYRSLLLPTVPTSWWHFWSFYNILQAADSCFPSSSSSSSTGTTAHCGLWPVEQDPSIFSYLSPTLSINIKSIQLFLCSTFVTIIFLLCGVVSSTPSPNLEDQGIPFCRQHSSWDHVTTQAPPLRQTRDTFGGGLCVSLLDAIPSYDGIAEYASNGAPAWKPNLWRHTNTKSFVTMQNTVNMGTLFVPSLRNQVLNYQWRLVEVATNVTHSLIHILRHAVYKDTIYLPKLSFQNFLHFVYLLDSEIILSDNELSWVELSWVELSWVESDRQRMRSHKWGKREKA
jgi:hypothetical protein